MVKLNEEFNLKMKNYLEVILFYYVCLRFKGGKSTIDDKYSYVPFGAGRHRCIGEAFAYVQIKTIWSFLIQKFKFDLVDGRFPSINVTTMIHTPENPVIAFERRKQI